MKLISTYYSEDETIVAWVFKTENDWLVKTLNNQTRKEYSMTFNSIDEAEDFAEDSVL